MHFVKVCMAALLSVVLALFAVAIVPFVGAQDGPSQVGLRPDAPPYALHGPYWVGTQSFVIEDTTDPIYVRVWYPALNANGAAEAIIYVFHWNKYVFEGVDNSVTSDISGHALADAPPDASAGPYPLVVFSHGSGAEPDLYAWLLEHIASYGFVVIAPDHKEIVDATNSDLVRTTIVRPQTISRVLDYAPSLTASSGALAGMIDMEHVAVTGQSYGGYTALAAAGARYDMVAYEDRCASLAPDDPNQFLCSFATSAADMAQVAGLKAIPPGLWPSMGDPRVDAIVTIAGDSYMFGEKGLAEIRMPVIAIGGTLDTATPYEWGVRPTFDNISSQNKILASFEGGDHFMSLTSCPDAPSIVEYGLYYFCSDSVWDMSRAHDLIGHFTTAFLLDELKSDQDAGSALAPDAVTFPGILYETQGF